MAAAHRFQASCLRCGQEFSFPPGDSTCRCPRCGDVFLYEDAEPSPSTPSLLPWLLGGVAAFLLLVGGWSFLADTSTVKQDSAAAGPAVPLVVTVPAAPVPPARVPAMAAVLPRAAGETRGTVVPVTHVLPRESRSYRLVVHRLEVAATKANGKVWDGGALGFTRPDPYVRAHRRDRALERQVETLELDLASLERRQTAQRQLAELRRQRDELPVDDARRRGYGARIARLESTAASLTVADVQRMEQLQRNVAEMRSRFDHTTQKVDDRYVVSFEEESICVEEGDRVSIGVWDRDVTIDDRIGEMKLVITRDMLRRGRVVLKFDQVVALELGFRRR